MSRNRVVYILISIALSILLLSLLFSQIKAEDFIETLKNISFPSLVVYMILALICAWLRAWRYKLFLKPEPIGWGNIMLATFIRNSFVDLLPARAGSLSLIYVLNRRLGFSFEAATSTFISAFVYDFLTLSPFLVMAIMAVGLGSASISNAALLAVASAFFLVVLGIAWKTPQFFAVIVKFYRALLLRLNQEEKTWARASLIKFQETVIQLKLIQEKRMAVPFFILSLGIRFTKYVSVYFLLYSLLRSHGFALRTLSFWKLILGITGAELTSALPVKGLAGFGTWESAWALTFRLMDFDPRLAILSGMGVHLLSNIFEYSLGIAAIIILALPWIKRKSTPASG